MAHILYGYIMTLLILLIGYVHSECLNECVSQTTIPLEWNNNQESSAANEHIEIESYHQPLKIHFNTRSSKLELTQSHTPNEPEVKRSNTEENPDILYHQIQKPIIHQVNEYIVPIQKTIQTILPVQNVLKTIIHKPSTDSNNNNNYTEPSNIDNMETMIEYNVDENKPMIASKVNNIDMLSVESDSNNNGHLLIEQPIENEYEQNNVVIQRHPPNDDMSPSLDESNLLDSTDIRKDNNLNRSTIRPDSTQQRIKLQRRSSYNRPREEIDLVKQIQRLATLYMLKEYVEQQKKPFKNEMKNKQKRNFKNQKNNTLYSDTSLKYGKPVYYSSIKRRNSLSSAGKSSNNLLNRKKHYLRSNNNNYGKRNKTFQSTSGKVKWMRKFDDHPL
ncbi:hypothetical protein BLOT_005982 [Blomia tropicalis]|nr:hypothetical protein BLOT_005982 [Blomia tropicalis]